MERKSCSLVVRQLNLTLFRGGIGKITYPNGGFFVKTSV